MKRFLIAASVGIASLSLLAACGDDATTTNGAAATSAADEGSVILVEGSGKQKLGPDVYTLEVSATVEDGEVTGSGSIVGASVKGSFTVECSAEEREIVMVGGTFDDGKQAGEGVALLIKDLDPDRVSVWFEGKPPADGCDSMLGNIPPDMLSDEMAFQPLEEGDFSTGG